MRDVKILEARKQMKKTWPSKERNPKSEAYLFHRLERSRNSKCTKDPRRQQLCMVKPKMGGKAETF